MSADSTSNALLPADHFPLTTWQRILLLAGSVLCYLIAAGVLGLLRVPPETHISTLLLKMQWHAILAVAILLPVLTLLVRYIVGNIRADAALFCAAIGLIFVPAHGGDIRQTLLDAGNSSVYWVMAIELAILTLVIVGTYFIVGRVSGQAKRSSDAMSDPISDLLTTVLAQAVATLVLMMFLGQSPLNGQAMAAAAGAGLLGTLIIHQAYGTRGSAAYVIGTMLAGIAAYIYTHFNDTGLAIGDVRGLLAGPARSLPLHYATAGVAGTIFGYWISVVWKANRLAASEPQPA